MDPVIANAAVALIREIVGMVEAHKNGERTEEEILQAFAEMQANVKAASDRWRNG